jgi:hypothetical protein
MVDSGIPMPQRPRIQLGTMPDAQAQRMAKMLSIRPATRRDVTRRAADEDALGIRGHCAHSSLRLQITANVGHCFEDTVVPHPIGAAADRCHAWNRRCRLSRTSRPSHWKSYPEHSDPGVRTSKQSVGPSSLAHAPTALHPASTDPLEALAAFRAEFPMLMAAYPIQPRPACQSKTAL